MDQTTSTEKDGATTFSPIHLHEIELARPLPHVRAADSYETAWLLVRLHGQPLGYVDIPLEGGAADPARYAPFILRSLGAKIDAHLARDGLPPSGGLTPEGLPTDVSPACLLERERFLASAPFMTVVICTRDRPRQLLRLLPIVLDQDHPSYEVLVVDNAPSSNELADELAARFGDEGRVRYVLEPQAGLARARNRGLREARAEHVAFLDDDEIPDRGWLSSLARGFFAAPDVVSVSGLILPAALDTPAQVWFERYGGHSKGRGFERAIFDRASHVEQDPLFPTPPFGAGGNMAFRRSEFLDLGGFDETLGAGTPVPGAEDTAAFYDVMRRGHTVVYEPAAFVRHDHYREPDQLQRQLHGYGVGLTAFYARALLREPRIALRLAGLVPAGLGVVLGGRSPGAGGHPFDAMASRARLRGMAVGPIALMASRWRARKRRGAT
jgi:O-antigen biosynthesis protein